MDERQEYHSNEWLVEKEGGQVKIHKDVTLDLVMEKIQEDSNAGFCTACGAEADGVEPDARNYECESCGERAVYGAEELLMMMA